MRVEIEDLHYMYPGGVDALLGVSLEIRAGERVAIVGENGAGKTTLVKHLNGLLKPVRGRVRIGDWDTRYHDIAELAARVGYVFQNPDEQLFSRTVQKEIAFGPRNLGYPPDRIEQLIERAIRLTGLGGKQDLNPYDLSPTWRKMVAVASILAMETPVLILDEPTTGQDHNSIERIGQIVDTLASDGRTVIVISHDIDFCVENFDRLIALRQGRLVLDAPMPEAISQVEVLASTFVEPPQISRLAATLGLSEAVLSVPDFVRHLRLLR